MTAKCHDAATRSSDGQQVTDHHQLLQWQKAWGVLTEHAQPDLRASLTGFTRQVQSYQPHVHMLVFNGRTSQTILQK